MEVIADAGAELLDIEQVVVQDRLTLCLLVGLDGRIGESVLNFFTGRSTRRTVSSATSKWNQAQAAAQNVEQSKQLIEQLTGEKQKLEEQLLADIADITARWEQVADALTTEQIKPRRTDVDVRTTALAWVPMWQVQYDDNLGERTTSIPAYIRP